MQNSLDYEPDESDCPCYRAEGGLSTGISGEDGIKNSHMDQQAEREQQETPPNRRGPLRSCGAHLRVDSSAGNTLE